MKNRLETITSRTCVHQVNQDCMREVCPYNEQRECDDYKAISVTNQRYAYLRLYKNEE